MCNTYSNASSNFIKNEINDTASVCSEYVDLLSQSDENNTYVTLHNNPLSILSNGYSNLPVQINNKIDIINVDIDNNIMLESTGKNIKKHNTNDDSLCNSLTKLIKGIITIPVLFGSYAVSTSDFDLQNSEEYNTAINNLRTSSKEVMFMSFDNTIKYFHRTTSKIYQHITNLGNDIFSVFNGTKTYIVNKMWR